MKKLLTILIIGLAVGSIAPILQAQESTDSATDEITENLKERLKNTLETARENIVLDEEVDYSKPKAFVGTVQDVVQMAVSITTKDGERFAKITDDTTILRTPGNAIIEEDDIQIDDFIIAMGYLESETTLTAKRIIVSQTLNPALDKTSGKGTIKERTTGTLLIVAPSGDETTLSLSSSTIVKSPTEVLDTDDLEEGQIIVYTADVDDEELDATVIMIVKIPSPAPTTDTSDSSQEE